MAGLATIKSSSALVAAAATALSSVGTRACEKRAPEANAPPPHSLDREWHEMEVYGIMDVCGLRDQKTEPNAESLRRCLDLLPVSVEAER